MKAARALFFACLLFTAPAAMPGQGLLSQMRQGEREQPEVDTAEVRIRPYPVAGLTSAFNASYNIVNETGNKRLKEGEIKRLSTRIDSLASDIDLFLADSVLQYFDGVSIRELDNAESVARLYLGQVEQLQEEISGRAEVFEEATEMLTNHRKRWQLTLDQMSGEELPEQTLERIRRAIRRTDSVRTIMQEDLGELLVQQERLASKALDLETLLEGIRNQKMDLSGKLFSRDARGFFAELSALKDTTLVPKHMEELKQTLRSDWEVFKSEYAIPLSFVSLFFVFLLAFAVWFKKHMAKQISVDKFELSEMHLTIVYSPLVTVIFITALLVRFLFPGLPHTFASLNLVVMMIPMLIIVIRLFGSLARGWMVTLIVIYILTFVYELVYYPDIYLRIILLVFSVAALGLFIWMIVQRPLSDRFSNTFIYRLFRIVLAFFAVLLFIAIAGNLAGALRLAEFFTLIPIQVSFLAIGIQVATRVADTIVFLLLASNTFQRLNVIRLEFGVIYKKTVGLINLILWIFFVVTALEIFRVKVPVFEWGGRMLTSGWQIGEVDITPKSILIFIFVIWLSITIARIIRHILEKDVFERVTVARGMPSTIVLLVRIGLITGGFFLAAAAAGMELTNLSIVIGAFSVGIGFGLQNIFNNMVSGLILAFERPIKVGDTVQVGELLGIVLSIGLRSSTVRSFDGAEVIVPNGNLISDQMINWTKSDSNRRMDIRVGVKYGTDPEKVLALMEEAAADHRQVDKKPSPRAYFIGFGDSSLDFRLLAWTDVQYRLEVESDLHVAVNRKIKEAGIEIPFPQRDLHLRSDFREQGEGNG